MPSYQSTYSSKLPGVGISIFSKMTRLALENQAVNLAQGFPDFNPSSTLIEMVNHAMISGFNQYAPSDGLLSLREAIAKKVSKYYHSEYDPLSEITVTSGATQALFTVFSAFIQEGDEVIIFEPAYDSYAPSIRLQGGIPVHIPLKAPSFDYDWDWVKRSINQRTKMIVVNSPHNPTGKLLTMEDLDALDRLTRNNDIIVVSDEVYEHIVFDQFKHFSLSSHNTLRNKTLVISSFGKTYHTTGWKVGYVCGPAALMAEFRKVHQFTVFSVNTAAQHGYAQFLNQDESANSLSSFYQEKRDFLLQGLAQTPFKVLQPEGSYFLLADYSSISELEDIKFTEWLCKNHQVALVPLSPFYHQNPDLKLVRFCFAKKEQTLEEAINRLSKL